jgi:hypothetical protein
MPKLDRSSFDILLKNLYQIKDTKISELKGEQKSWFDSLVNFVKILYGTPYFQKLYQKITEVFGNIQEIKPGTVSGYILGSILSRSFYKKYSPNSNDDTWVCSPFSLNALPTLNQPECRYFVITLEPDITGRKGYNLVMNKSSNEDKAIIFTMSNFSGLTSEDKTKLKNYGITHVKVFKIGPKDFFDIIGNWTHIDTIPTFGSSHVSKNTGGNVAGGITPSPTKAVEGANIDTFNPPGLSGGMLALIIIGAVVFAVAIVLIAWMLMKQHSAEREKLKEERGHYSIN